MDLAIDIQPLQSPQSRARGIGRFSRNLVEALASARPEWNFELLFSRHLEPPDKAFAGNLPRRRFTPPLPAVEGNREANERYYADWLAARGADAVLLLNLFDREILVPAFSGCRPPVFGVVYDLIPLLFFDHYLRDAEEEARYARRFRRLRALEGLLAISHVTANDVRELLGDGCPDISVIGGAPDPLFISGQARGAAERHRRLRRKLALEREFVLCVGGPDFRKNLSGALRAFADLPEEFGRDLDLVLACDMGEEQSRLRAEAIRLGVGDRLRFTGFVADLELRSLYEMCRVFFFPSLYEGLGLPVMEALAAGAPVVASNVSSMAEVAGDVCRLVDPHSTRELSKALEDALRQPRERRIEERRARGRGFSWSSVAERACRFLENPGRERMGPTWSGNGTSRRRRIAWVSPISPAHSGIAEYSATLIDRLDSDYEIELVLDPAVSPPAPRLADRFRIFCPAEIPARHEAQPYDLFLYQVGNSHHHVYMLEMLSRFPGLVVLHEVFLGGLVLDAIRAGCWPATLEEELESGDQEIAREWRKGSLSETALFERLALNRRILSPANGIVVHSEWAIEQVRAFGKNGYRHGVLPSQSPFFPNALGAGMNVPIARIPAPVPAPAEETLSEAREALGLDLADYIIVTAGTASERSRLPSLLRALARLSAGVQASTRLFVVGSTPPRLRSELDALVHRLGIDPMVEFTGRVPKRDFARYIAAADVAVQLRCPSRGETSASALLALASGTPCIVSAGGPADDIPPDVVVKIDPGATEVTALARALAGLGHDIAWRQELSERSRDFARKRHGPASVAASYASMIERCIAARQSADALWFEGAANALGSCADVHRAATVIESWAALRLAARARWRTGPSPAREKGRKSL